MQEQPCSCHSAPTKLEEFTRPHHVSSLENEQLYQKNRQRYSLAADCERTRSLWQFEGEIKLKGDIVISRSSALDSFNSDGGGRGRTLAQTLFLSLSHVHFKASL